MTRRRAAAVRWIVAALAGAVLVVEAKVDEGFDKRVSDWLGDGSEGKRDRLARLCALLGIAEADAGPLRYQLFHRTAAAILEARRYRASKAVMLVQSFCPDASGYGDYVAFGEQMGLTDLRRDEVSRALELRGVALRIGWVADRLSAN